MSFLSAQNTFKAVVESDEEEPDLLEGAAANVVGTQLSALADSNGIVIIRNIADGEQIIEFSYLGYFKKRIKVTFPLAKGTPPFVVKLQAQSEEIKRGNNYFYP